MNANRHPHEAQLALYASGDLGFWQQRRVRGHVEACADCGREVRALQQTTVRLRELAAEQPEQLNWQRLAQEMTGNIRVGLAAGECIAGFEKTNRTRRPKLFWHTAGVLGCATVVVLATLWVNLPKPELDHLLSSLGQIRWERIGTVPHSQAAAAQDWVVLEASPSSIEVKSNGHALTLMHPRSDGATVSINMQDSAGVRYVDADSGQVTINKVYYAQ